MKKILIVIATAFVPYGGLATVMMNYYQAIDKTDLQIDFASTNTISDNFINKLRINNSKYFNLGSRKRTPLLYLQNLKKVITKQKYDIIHVNGNSATMALELYMAKLCGIKCRIAHGHITRSSYPVLHKLLFPIFRISYTHAIAVSKQTGDWLFRHNYDIFNNAIDLYHYKYSEDLRKKFRKRYGINEATLVIGNVGKLNIQKNHSYLIKIFKEIKDLRKDSILLIVGGGELEGELKTQTKKLGISDSVIFLGMVDDTSESLQAMDVFVFTSIFEGLGMSLIEAQASGLPCIASETIPKETQVSEFVQYFSLSEKPKRWADAVLSLEMFDRDLQSKNACNQIKEKGYDIQHEAYKLRTLYINLEIS